MKTKKRNLAITVFSLFFVPLFVSCNNNGVKQKDFYGLYRVDSLWYDDTSQRTRELINDYKSVQLILKEKDSFKFISPARTITGTWDLSEKSKSYGLSFSVNGDLIFADFNYQYILFDRSGSSFFDTVFQTVRLVRFDTDKDHGN